MDLKRAMRNIQKRKNKRKQRSETYRFLLKDKTV
jgi:hypothetical protein